MKRIIFTLIAILTLESCLFAENVTREDAFASISGISAGNKFNIKLVDGPSIKLTMTTEDVLADYIHLTLVDGILTLTFDEKSITKEVKAVLKHRDPKSIRMDAVLSVPSSCKFNSVSLSESAVLESDASFGSCESFALNVTGNAVVKSLNINSKEATVGVAKHADVKITMSCSNSIIRSEGNSVVELDVSGNEASVESIGASSVKLVSTASAIRVNAAGSSNVSLSGTGTSLEIEGKNSARIDASGLNTKTAKITANGSTCKVNAQDNLSVCLSGGAKIHFAGSPAVEIIKVEKSSIYKNETSANE